MNIIVVDVTNLVSFVLDMAVQKCTDQKFKLSNGQWSNDCSTFLSYCETTDNTDWFAKTCKKSCGKCGVGI